MIEDALKDALQELDGLAGKVYKLAAPKSETAPFVVFGKYIFFCGIVSVYQIVMIIFFCQDSAEGENRYGASPKYEEEPPCVPPEERKE